MPERLTKDLLRNLCTELEKDDCAPILVKTLVGKNWLQQVDDLKQVPPTRLEGWGVPLKLIDEIYEFLLESEADEDLHILNSYINYTVRPALQSVSNYSPTNVILGLSDSALKRQQPRTWAARKLQRWFRNRQARRARKPLVTDQEVLSWVEDGEFLSKKDPAKEQERREKRAKEALAKGVARWRERKAREKREGRPARVLKDTLPTDPFLLQIVKNNPETIPAQLAKRAAAKPLACEVTELFVEFGKTLNQTEDEMRPYIHRLVTINWLEQKEDLRLIEDRHWELWAIPEKLVVLAKEQAALNPKKTNNR
eukprot:TRINITY_DN57381_c0_g1_i1.p1 TRINITY_DN57381_c0_g1~~TRINITY_DN57381_c0_g1_i1.p1  ORF type:complete len:311 (+),score=75.76 TRINITY_DN57381_c0_g1_i1:65-997(+)